MRVRFSGTPPNFILAFMVAPFAGAVTAILLAFIVVFAANDDRRWRFVELMAMAAAVGVYALILCALFTVVIGTCVVAYVHLRRHIPSLLSALTIGFLIAVGVFLLLDVGSSRAEADLGFLGLAGFAGVCSLPTTWSFWWLGLRGRRTDD